MLFWQRRRPTAETGLKAALKGKEGNPGKLHPLEMMKGQMFPQMPYFSPRSSQSAFLKLQHGQIKKAAALFLHQQEGCPGLDPQTGCLALESGEIKSALLMAASKLASEEGKTIPEACLRHSGSPYKLALMRHGACKPSLIFPA